MFPNLASKQSTDLQMVSSKFNDLLDQVKDYILESHNDRVSLEETF